MKTLSVSEAKMKLSGLVEMVSTRDEEVVITKNGRPVAVLISVDERESWGETLAVLADRALMEEIQAGLGALKRRRAKLYTLEELLP
jgi:prevent-host-death family protein